MAGQKRQTAIRTGTAIPLGQRKKQTGRPSLGNKASRKSLGTPTKAKRRRSGAQGGYTFPLKYCLSAVVTPEYLHCDLHHQSHKHRVLSVAITWISNGNLQRMHIIPLKTHFHPSQRNCDSLLSAHASQLVISNNQAS